MTDIEVDIETLRGRLEPVGVDELRRLAGGASSLSYLGILSGSGRRVVVKVAPAGVLPIRHRDVLRQARALRALRETAVPVPSVLWEDAGDPPEVPPLFVMSFVEGVSVEPLFDVGLGAVADDSPTVTERLHGAARTLAALHDLRPVEIGFSVEPVVGVRDEIERWTALLRTIEPSLVAGWHEVAASLGATAPNDAGPSLVHGDFRLGNLIAAGPRIAAVVDWEIWSVGDPRIDLGWFLVNAAPETYRRASPYAGSLPTPRELLATYAAAVAGDVAEIAWFCALACFKSAATWSLIVKHNRRRSTPDLELEAMVDVLGHLLRLADPGAWAGVR